jgi:hypothetical protein
VVIKCVDMRPDMQKEALSCATRVSLTMVKESFQAHRESLRGCFLDQAVEAYTVDKDIAAALKRHFDMKYTSTWHCIVGKDFGGSLMSRARPDCRSAFI